MQATTGHQDHRRDASIVILTCGPLGLALAPIVAQAGSARAPSSRSVVVGVIAGAPFVLALGSLSVSRLERRRLL